MKSLTISNKLQVGMYELVQRQSGFSSEPAVYVWVRMGTQQEQSLTFVAGGLISQELDAGFSLLKPY